MLISAYRVTLLYLVIVNTATLVLILTGHERV